jgi:hypothetical protein
MLDFPIVPPITVRDGRAHKLTTLNETRALVDELLAQRRFGKWREMLQRLDSVKTEEEAVEAIGALRAPGHGASGLNTSPRPQHSRSHGSSFRANFLRILLRCLWLAKGLAGDGRRLFFHRPFSRLRYPGVGFGARSDDPAGNGRCGPSQGL